MKRFILKNIVILTLASLIIVGCKEDEEQDSVAPGQVSNVQVVPWPKQTRTF